MNLNKQFADIVGPNYVFGEADKVLSANLRLMEIKFRAYVVAFAEMIGDNPELTEKWTS
jgi:hypothetical protein